MANRSTLDSDEVLAVRVDSKVKARIAAWQTQAGIPTIGEAARIVLEMGLRRVDGRKIRENANPLSS